MELRAPACAIVAFTLSGIGRFMVMRVVGLIAMNETDDSEIRVNDGVTVTYPESSARTPKPAVVMALPPNTEKIGDSEITYDTEIKVRYTGGMQATEFVEPEQIQK